MMPSGGRVPRAPCAICSRNRGVAWVIGSSQARSRSSAGNNTAREVITEVGNIVLNACLGVFGNLLKVQVSFSVPRLHVESIGQVFNSITVADRELEYALMIHTRFYVQAGNVSGYLVIVLGVTSLDRLLFEVKQWEERQLIS